MMSARSLLRWLLVAQAAAVLALAAGLVHFGVLRAWPLALLAACGVVLLCRLLITANNFLLTARFASTTPEHFVLGWRARAALFAEEFMSTLLHSSWFMARAVACERIYPDSPCPPVLLLHGYGCNSGYWAHLMARLGSAHVSHAALDLEPVMGDIDAYVPMVAQACEALCAKTNADQVIIVAHSMGGLVARAYLREHGADRIAHVFTLGTPHHGTSLANFGIGANAAQMRRAGAGDAPESAWLRALAASENADRRALFTSIYTHHDNIVAPQTSSHLPGARHIEFGGIGHVALGRNARVLECLMHEIVRVEQG